jgi:UDP-N-acetylmuramoylalanine--D-glutamate ligase
MASLNNWTNNNITILGLGKSGRASAEYLAKRGARVIVSEAKDLDAENQKHAQALKEVGVLVESGGHRPETIKQADVIITSPGIKPNSDVIKLCLQENKNVIADIEVAYRDATMPIIAVTGTNGKSTTTAWISFMLERTGLKAPACGNIGLPVLSALEQKPDYLIIETSSFQLFYADLFAPKIGVWTNLTSDHVDWHGSLQDYITAKASMFNRQDRTQYAVLNIDDPIVAGTKTEAEIFPFSARTELKNNAHAAYLKNEFLCYRRNVRTHVLNSINDLQVIGQHNLENALATIAAVSLLDLEPEQIEAGLKEFKGLEHRLEYVDTVDGVACYNDSKATNPDSAIKALEAFKEKIVLIAGGRDKNTSLDEFVESVRKHTAAVILLGEARERFERALTEGGVRNIYSVAQLDQAVDLGVGLHLGPLVLSPACASFDMFKDFEDRGSVFKDIVRTRRQKNGSTPP